MPLILRKGDWRTDNTSVQTFIETIKGNTMKAMVAADCSDATQLILLT